MLLTLWLDVWCANKSRLNTNFLRVYFSLYKFLNGSGSVSPWILLVGYHWNHLRNILFRLYGSVNKICSLSLPVHIDYSLQKFARLYIAEIVRLHGIPVSIIFYRYPRFTLLFQRSLHEALNTRLNFTIAYLPQSNGQSARVTQILEDTICGCVIQFKGNWEEHLLVVEFCYNNSF